MSINRTSPSSAYRLVLAERDKTAKEIDEMAFDDPKRELRFRFLDGLDRALDVIVREQGTD